MELKSISRLAELMARHGLSELEIKENDTSIRLCRPLNGAVVPPIAMAAEEEPVIVPENVPATAEPGPPEPLDESRYITAPMLGTFFSAATPEAPAFVAEGDVVTPDTVVCIIEAMKLMNEIIADRDGEILDVCLQNGAVVEYGQALFKVN